MFNKNNREITSDILIENKKAGDFGSIQKRRFQCCGRVQTIFNKPCGGGIVSTSADADIDADGDASTPTSKPVAGTTTTTTKKKRKNEKKEG